MLFKEYHMADDKKLRFRLTDDRLFKVYYVENPDLLKHFLATILNIDPATIGRFQILNSWMVPKDHLDKFCVLDLQTLVGDRRVNIEIQVRNDHNFPARPLHYWSRAFDSALRKGKDYRTLPRVVRIRILNLNLFPYPQFYSNYLIKEDTLNIPLSDHLQLVFIELKKLPETFGPEDILLQWLHLIGAKTTADMENVAAVGGPIMRRAVDAYGQAVGSSYFKELQRIRSNAKYLETTVVAAAVDEAVKKERKRKDRELARKDKEIALKDKEIALKDKEIERLAKMIKK